MVLILLIAGNKLVMGRHANGIWAKIFGWGATAVMFAASIALFVMS
jgi:Mn2+/Fe2+ NRAMP family transporter